MRKDKIQQEYFGQTPILLLIECVYIGILNSLDSFETFWEFEQNDKAHVADIDEKTCDENQEIRKVNKKAVI